MIAKHLIFNVIIVSYGISVKTSVRLTFGGTNSVAEKFTEESKLLLSAKP